MEENKEHNVCNCNHQKSNHHWIKFATLLLALFLGCYLASYYILDQIRHAYYLPSMPIDKIDRIINEQEKMFEGMGALPLKNSTLMNIKMPIETYKDDENDTYKIVIDLKPFNNNENNVSVDVQRHQISINGIGEKTNNKGQNLYSFSQSFMIPEKIDTSKVKKEKSGNKYIITMPIED